jgi:TolB-like protein
MFADVVGYSRLIGVDDIGTLARLRNLRRDLIDPAIQGHGGRLVSTGGDSLLVVFESAEGAVRCAVKVQEQLPILDAEHPPDRAIRFRIGVNVGDAIADGTDVHGEAVNIAARLQAECPAGGVCVSRSVREHAQGRLGLKFQELGPLNLKNIARPIEAFVLRIVAPISKVTPLTALMRDHSIAKAPRLSLVVLPFDNIGGDPNEDYLADVITEDLTTDLSRLPGVVLIARHSAGSYKAKPSDKRRIGEELGVRYVVEGSVRKLGDVLRVNVQLITSETNTHIWAGRFDQDLGDISTGQEEMVSRLSAALGIQMFDAESARRASESPDDPDAFAVLLRAQAAERKSHSIEQLPQLAALFEQALLSDPSSVPAMLDLSATLIDRYVIPDYPERGNEDLIERAAALVAAATAIEPNSERVMLRQALLSRAQGRWPEAIAIYQRLIEISPNNPSAYRLLGYMKLAIGNAKDAIPLLQKSIRVDPLSPYNRHTYQRIGLSLLLLGRDEESIEWQQRSLTGGVTDPPPRRAQCLLFMASAQALIGHSDDAHRAVAEANRLSPFSTVRNMLPHQTPRGLPVPTFVAQMSHVQAGLRLAGLRDCAEENADFGVPPSSVLNPDLIGLTPITVPGAQTIQSGELLDLISQKRPILIDVALDSWGRSIAGAIGLQGTGYGASFSEKIQSRFNIKLNDLTKGDLSAPIVVFCVNSERFTGYNLALRLVARGHTQVYWYRGGVEAWQVNKLPESELVLQDW